MPAVPPNPAGGAFPWHSHAHTAGHPGLPLPGVPPFFSTLNPPLGLGHSPISLLGSSRIHQDISQYPPSHTSRSIPTVPHLPLHPATHPQSPQYGVRPCVIDKKKPAVPHGSNKNFSVCCHGTLDKRCLLIYETINGCTGDTRSAGRIPVALVALSWQLKKIFWECPTHWISKETSA